MEAILTEITWDNVKPIFDGILKMVCSKEILKTKIVDPAKTYTDIDVSDYPNKNKLWPLNQDVLLYSWNKRNNGLITPITEEQIEIIKDFIQFLSMDMKLKLCRYIIFGFEDDEFVLDCNNWTTDEIYPRRKCITDYFFPHEIVKTILYTTPETRLEFVKATKINY